MISWPSSKWVWAFTLISLTQAAIILVLEVYVFVQFQKDLGDNAEKVDTQHDPTTTIPTFLALYIFAFIYQLFLVWDALRMKNTIQVIGLVGLNIGLLIYGAVQVEQIHDAVTELGVANINQDLWTDNQPFLIAIPCILGLFTIALAFVAHKLYNEFAWTIYKHISADLQMKRRYLTYQIYIALLKFDFFFCLGFTLQFVVIVGGRNIIERSLTAAAIPVTIVIMFAAFWFARRENMPGTIVVIFLYFAGLTYFCYKLVRMYQNESEVAYTAARKELTTFAVLTIGLLISTIIMACKCAHNYGRGLKPYVMNTHTKAVVSPHNRPQIDYENDSANSYPSTTSYPMQVDPYQKQSGRITPARMEID